MDSRPASLYRAISLFKSRNKHEDNYAFLPSYLAAFASKNPESRVSCQLDEFRRFYRAFLLIEPVVSVQSGFLPVYHVDATHMKNGKYNGVCLTLVVIDGNGQVILVAVIFVPSETTDNFSWFIANCIAGGVNLDDIALFTDRGKQRGAQIRLDVLGSEVCSFHIVLNVKEHFRSVEPLIDVVQPYIMRLQKSDNIAEYNATLSLISEKIPNAHKIRNNDGSIEYQTIEQYLRKIHPTSGTNFGNYPPSEVERSFFAEHWVPSKAYGKPTKLYGVKTTSATEGENHALIWSGTRICEVLSAFVTFYQRASESIADKISSAENWRRDGSNVTPKA